MNGLDDINPAGMLVLTAVAFGFWVRMVVVDLRRQKLRRDLEAKR